MTRLSEYRTSDAAPVTFFAFFILGVEMGWGEARLLVVGMMRGGGWIWTLPSQKSLRCAGTSITIPIFNISYYILCDSY